MNSRRALRRSGRVRTSLDVIASSVSSFLFINSWKGVSDAIKIFSIVESDQSNLDAPTLVTYLLPYNVVNQDEAKVLLFRGWVG